MCLTGFWRPAAHESGRPDHLPWTSGRQVCQACGVLWGEIPVECYVLSRSTGTVLWDNGEVHSDPPSRIWQNCILGSLKLASPTPHCCCDMDSGYREKAHTLYWVKKCTIGYVIPAPSKILLAFSSLVLTYHSLKIKTRLPIGVIAVNISVYFLEQGLPGVPKLQGGLNPATWMLQISTPGMEKMIGIDFASAYTSSNTFRWEQCPSEPSNFELQVQKLDPAMMSLCFSKKLEQSCQATLSPCIMISACFLVRAWE